MVDLGATLACLGVTVFAWAFLTISMMIELKYNGTKQRREQYPYYSNPFFKKIFFTGLKGVLPRAYVLLAFITNILTLVLIIASIWNIITANIITSYIIKIGAGIYCGLFVIRLVIHATSNFKV